LSDHINVSRAVPVYSPFQELQAQINGRRRELRSPVAKLSIYNVETEKKNIKIYLLLKHIFVFVCRTK